MNAQHRAAVRSRESDRRLPEAAPIAVESGAEVPSLARQARRGALWSGASAILLRFSNVLVMIIVARIIAPDELGVYALAITVHGFVVCIAAWGVGSAIGRSDLDADKLGPTVTTFAIASGFVTASAMALVAGPLATLLGSPEAAGPIRVLSITVALTGLFAVPSAQIQRSFRQDVMFRGNLIAFFGSNATLLLLSTVTHGAMAFAWSRVVGHIIVGAVIIALLDRRYRPGWRTEYIQPLLRFGVPAALGGVLSQLVLNVDFVIVSHQMSVADLGLYMLAFNICAWPTAVLGTIMNEIVLPAFSGVRRDGGDLQATVSRAVRTVALVACPIAGFTCAFAYPLIGTVYGDQWLDAAPVVTVLALYGVVYVLAMMFDNIIIASGRTVAIFVVHAIALTVLIPALIIGVRLGGLVGVGIAHIIVVTFVILPAYLFAIRQTTGAGLIVTLQALVRPLAAAATAAVIATLATRSMEPAIVKLAVGGIVGAFVYAAIAGRSLSDLLPERLAQNRAISLAVTWPELLWSRLRTLPVDERA